jgi:hypothetical protein
MVEHLPSKHKALSSNSSTINKKIKSKGKFGLLIKLGYSLFIRNKC